MLPVDHPHSAYLAVLLDLGLVGIAVVGAFFWSAWRIFRRLSQDDADSQWRGVFEGGLVALMCLFIQGLTGDHFVPTYSQAALWVCYGLALGHRRCSARSRTLVPRSPLRPHSRLAPQVYASTRRSTAPRCIDGSAPPTVATTTQEGVSNRPTPVAAG